LAKCAPTATRSCFRRAMCARSAAHRPRRHSRFRVAALGWGQFNPTFLMPDEPEKLHQLGAFEPHEAKKVLPRLETEGIHFELEVDNTELMKPTHAAQLNFGIYPEGSKLVVFVPESELENALAAVKDLFPV